MSFKHKNIRVGIEVTRYDSKWIPFEYRMFYCKQQDTHIWDWANESTGLLGVLGGVPGEHKMQVGEVRKYWVHGTLTYSTDYWGESDQDFEMISVKRVK